MRNQSGRPNISESRPYSGHKMGTGAAESGENAPGDS